MFKKVTRLLKNNYIYMKDIINDAKKVRSIYKSDEKNKDGFIFEKNSYEVAKNKAAFAVCDQVIFGNVFLMEKVPLIITDNLFEKLSFNSQEFVIAHELGHFDLGHLDDTDLERNKNKEIAADAYAVAKLGNKTQAIVALNEFKTILKSINPLYDASEIDLRIKKIEAL